MPYQGAVVVNESFLIPVTPLDVVKVRLQAQQKTSSVVHKCFLYCNGLMDHICPCINSPSSQGTYWYSRPGHFSGTFVSIKLRLLKAHILERGMCTKNEEKRFYLCRMRS